MADIAENIMWSCVRNDSVHMQGKGPLKYELLVMSGKQAIETLFPVWDTAMETFEQRLLRLPAGSPKAQALATSYCLYAPTMVCARRRIGKPQDVIIFDGCNRLLAVALRASWGWPLPACVAAFVEIRPQ